MKGVSIVVCFYNAASRIEKTLEHLALQKVDEKVSWEIVFVDNSSSDYSLKIVQNFYTVHKNKISIQIVREPKAGLSFAREKGVRQARYDYIIFCDDDNWLQENYVDMAYKIISSNSKIGALGGQSTAVTNANTFPAWFDDFKEGYAIGQQAEKSAEISDRGYLWGAGLVLRRDLYLKAFSKFPGLLSGRKGEVLTSGEDSEICKRLLLMGYELHYSEELHFKHFVSRERLTIEYKNKLFQGFALCSPILKAYDKQIVLNKLSIYSKFNLIIKSFFKLIVRNLKFSASNNANLERTNIFMLTSVKIGNIDDVAYVIKQATRNETNF